MFKYSIVSCLLLAAAITTSAAAYQPQARRAFFSKAAAAAAVIAVSPQTALALDACPPKSNNCIRTTWTPPSGTSASDATKTLLQVLQAYPESGQADVDKGGYTIVSDASPIKVEYKSGIGNFAKFFNGGKPFVDDLTLEVGSEVQVKSSSRVGDSDFDVNKKRLLYLGEALTAKGWSIPEPKY